jgi:acetyltransferase-like isoleucine patch superfamily enzyme
MLKIMNIDYWIRRIVGKATCISEAQSRITWSARIRNIRGDSGLIRIGNYTLIAGELLTFAHGGEIEIGDWCFVGPGTRVWSGAKIKIGSRVLISHNVNIFDSLTHPLDAEARHQHFRHIFRQGHPSKIDLDDQPVTIGDDVWIGANASILRGVNIGPRAIVGIGSVVTKNVPADGVVAGNPARVIRTRADSATIRTTKS